MKIVSLILARGGSKSIPRKNIYLLKEKPLISYSIQESLKSDVNETWVCTDNDEISEVSIAYKAKVLKRPNYLATDFSKSEETLLFFAEKINFDILVFIQPTSPLIISQDINNGISMMSKYDSIFSAYKEHWIPRWNMDGTPDNWNILQRPMRQQMPEKFVENGALYITTKNALLSSKCRYSGKIGVLEMPLHRSFQIDTYDDLILIEKLL